MLVWIGVAALGSVATLARFFLSRLVSVRTPEIPLGTLVVNTTGALVLGVLSGTSLSGDALLLTGTATIGSYTTFSTWMLETHRLAEDDRRAVALLNVLLSVALGIGAVALGRAIAGAL